MTSISICIPTFNREKMLLRLLNNIYNQNISNIETVIVNDGSSDNTESIIKSFSKKMNVVFHNQINQGRANALRKAILLANNEYLIIMDDEDYFKKDSLSKIINELDALSEIEKNNLCGLVYLTEDLDGKVIGNRFIKSHLISNLIKIRADYNSKGDKKEIIKSSIVKDVLYENKYNERRVPTSLIWSRIAVNYNCKFINEVVVVKDYLDTGMTKNINQIRKKSPYSSRQLYKELVEKNFDVYNSKFFRFKQLILFYKYNFYCLNKTEVKINIIYKIFAYPLAYVLILSDLKLKL